MLDVLDLAVADDHVGVAVEDGRDELADVPTVVLVVGVGVDDHIGAELQARVQAGLEARGEALVVGEADDVVDASSRATSTVRSVEPSSITSHSTSSTRGSSRGRSASVAGSVSSSSRQGIWMISFIPQRGYARAQASPARGTGGAIPLRKLAAGSIACRTSSSTETPARDRAAGPAARARTGVNGALKRVRRPRATAGRLRWPHCWSRAPRAGLAGQSGLPYAYNVDENAHFVPRAVGFFGHTLNPYYFVNPPALSYVLYVVFGLWFGDGTQAAEAYATDASEVWLVARVTVAVIATFAVWLTYLAGKRLFDRQVALLGAGILAFAFLPVFYSRLALNDAPAMSAVALSLLGTALILRHGRWFDYVIAGAGLGLAISTIRQGSPSCRS